jgi:hypothetical protein
MLVWLGLIGVSAAIGAACGLMLRGKRAILLGALLPWLTLLAVLLAFEYLGPHEPGGGASMWPVAQLVAGTVAAVVGLLAALVGRRINRRRDAPNAVASA